MGLSGAAVCGIATWPIGWDGTTACIGEAEAAGPAELCEASFVLEAPMRGGLASWGGDVCARSESGRPRESKTARQVRVRIETACGMDFSQNEG